MSKRSDFRRFKADAYDTPAKAVEPLVPHLPKRPFFYAELCAGAMMLADNMPVWAKASLATDIEPRSDRVRKVDAMALTAYEMSKYKVDFIITNPPWTRQILHPMIEHFRQLRPTWLLFDSDWAFTKQAAAYLPYCAKIVAVGRVRWIEGTAMDGKDNCAWYLFLGHKVRTQFFGRGDS